MISNRYFFYKLAQDLSMGLSRKFAYRIASGIAMLYYFFYKRERQALWHNFRIMGIEEEEIPKYARQVFCNFAKNLVDFFRFGLIDKRFLRERVKIVGLENMDEAFKMGRGILGITAHLGNWELGGVIMAQKGYPLNAVAWEHNDPRINKLFLSQRRRKGINVIPLGIALRRCFEALKNNEMVAMLGDRDFSPRGNRTEVIFLGRPFKVPRGPATLSLRTGAVIVPGFTIRERDDSFTLYFEKPVKYIPSGNYEKDIAELTQRFMEVIEKYVKEYPEQWFMFREFWEQQAQLTT
ncbi:MAG: lysophospholipid acyltransferase family protein [Candidatus Omnitrophica bacterium]|nr:lysophospholipid acyltransferase family protein [Candidatus Omnitrophota bacterium]